MQGIVVVDDSPGLAAKVATAYEALGLTVGADDAYLALRGLRTRHATAVAEWLQRQPQVARVFYPALPDDPGHALWRRDFSGASGLVSFAFRDAAAAAAAGFVAALRGLAVGGGGGGCALRERGVAPGDAVALDGHELYEFFVDADDLRRRLTV